MHSSNPSCMSWTFTKFSIRPIWWHFVVSQLQITCARRARMFQFGWLVGEKTIKVRFLRSKWGKLSNWRGFPNYSRIWHKNYFNSKNLGDFFLRSAKWAQFPSGGSLVSGRGGFRPGFNSQNGWRQFVYDFRKARFKLIPDYCSFLLFARNDAKQARNYYCIGKAKLY